LIRALETDGRPMSLTQLASATNMSTSQAHLYLASYVHEGLVRQDPESNRYELGPYALQLGIAAMRGLNVLSLAREELQNLRDRSSESAHFSIWSERGPCIVLTVDGRRPLPFSSRLGFALPLLSSATGRVFLAYLPKSDTELVLSTELADGKAQGRVFHAEDVDELIRDIRASGFSYTDSMVNIGLSALAAPVFAVGGKITGVLTLIAPSGVLSKDELDAATQALQTSAATLCARLTGKPS
jgi:DNA-binding IclR family transcriptional regulator